MVVFGVVTGAAESGRELAPALIRFSSSHSWAGVATSFAVFSRIS
jgi:hypothetical protein